MDKILFVCNFERLELRMLHRLLALRDAGARVEVIDVNAMELQGKRPEVVIIDDMSRYYKPQRLIEAITQMRDYDVTHAATKHSRPYLDNRPQSKGDRHRNRRYRWS